MPWLDSLSALYGEGVGTISIIVRTKWSEADTGPSHPGAYHHANGRQKETYKPTPDLGLEPANRNLTPHQPRQHSRSYPWKRRRRTAAYRNFVD